MTQTTTDAVLDKLGNFFKKPSNLLTERNFSNAIIDTLNKEISFMELMGKSAEVIDDDLENICAPPPINQDNNINQDSINKILQSKFTISSIMNSNNNFIKLFWSGWTKLTQLLACKIAQDITKNNCKNIQRELCGARGRTN